LKQAFHGSAFCVLSFHETSKPFYQRKREEGEHHHQTVPTLACRGMNVLRVVLDDMRI
jgi:hypothetical protein